MVRLLYNEQASSDHVENNSKILPAGPQKTYGFVVFFTFKAFSDISLKNNIVFTTPFSLI